YGGKALDFDSSAVQAVFRKLSAQDGCRRPLLLSEPATSAEKTRLRCLLAELSFEALEAPEVSTLSSALLATLARGKSNGTVVDIGAGLTSIAPLLNGCVEPECLREQTFAGNALDIMVLDALKSQGVTLSMPSRNLGQANTGMRLAQDIKESICFCAYAPLASLEKPKEYRHRLPDNQEIEVTAFSRQIPEALLTGTVLRGECFFGVPQLASEAILTLPVGASSAGSEVILVGGSSRFVNFKDRLQVALADYLDGRQVKVTQVDNRYASCLGASVAAQLKHPLVRWVTRSEYQEHGSHVFTRL
ncbi:Actin-like protein 9, partial [Durusdinium trenchii]